MKKYAAVFLLFIIAACATPEQTLDKGYKSASVTVRGTTAALKRGSISITEAERVEALGRIAKQALDTEKNALAKCRATPGAVCTNTISNINLSAGVLGQLETYLEAREKQ